MSSFSDYAENKILDDLFSATYTKPTTYYVALYTVAPTDSTGGTEVSTGTWTTYARQPLVRGTTDWNTAASGIVTNKTLVTFPTVDGSLTIVAAAVCDASTAGNIIAWATITNRSVIATDVVTIAIGALSISLD